MATCSNAALAVGAPKLPLQNDERTVRNRAFFDARALPSRSRDLTLFGQHLAIGAALPPRICRRLGRRSGRIPAEPYPPPRCCQYRPASIKNARTHCRRRLRHGITMLVLLQFHWPVLRCPSLAGFQPSPEGSKANGAEVHSLNALLALFSEVFHRRPTITRQGVPES
jgi:hypothetical protein